MANEQNLLKGDEKHKFTPEEHSKGGKASAEARRKKRDLKLALEALLEKDYTDKNGNKATGTEVLATKLFEQAMRGNVRAFETLRDTVGQKPVERFVMAEIDQETVDEVEAMMLGDDDE